MLCTLLAEKNQKKAIIPEKERTAEEDESVVRSARQLKALMNDRKSGECGCCQLLDACPVATSPEHTGAPSRRRPGACGHDVVQLVNPEGHGGWLHRLSEIIACRAASPSYHESYQPAAFPVLRVDVCYRVVCL